MLSSLNADSCPPLQGNGKEGWRWRVGDGEHGRNLQGGLGSRERGTEDASKTPFLNASLPVFKTHAT